MKLVDFLLSFLSSKKSFISPKGDREETHDRWYSCRLESDLEVGYRTLLFCTPRVDSGPYRSFQRLLGVDWVSTRGLFPYNYNRVR